MKRNAFVLVLLILIVAPTGCRRRQGLCGRLRGSQCAGQTSYSAGVVMPTQCPGGTTAYGGEIYGGSAIDGGVINGGVIHNGVIDGNVIDGGVIDGGIINGGTIGPYYDSSINGPFPSVGSESVPANLAPSLGSSNIYGRPMFQVVGDRKLAPGETLPSETEVTPPTQSEQTAKAPAKK